MPRSPQSQAVTRAYRAQLLTTRRATTIALQRTWSTIDARDLRATFDRASPIMAAVVAGGQRAAAANSRSYVHAYLASELQTPRVLLPAVNAEPFAGRTRDGRPLDAALATGLYTMLAARAMGRTDPQTLASGFNRTGRAMAAQVMGAGRGMLAALTEQADQTEGWVRVVSDDGCGACLAMTDGALIPDGEPEVHDNCRCVAEPVVLGVPNLAPNPTGANIFNAKTTAEQDALFAGRGGAEKADLIRTGDVSLAALIQVEPQATGGVQVTERPLSSLT